MQPRNWQWSPVPGPVLKATALHPLVCAQAASQSTTLQFPAPVQAEPSRPHWVSLQMCVVGPCHTVGSAAATLGDRTVANAAAIILVSAVYTERAPQTGRFRVRYSAYGDMRAWRYCAAATTPAGRAAWRRGRRPGPAARAPLSRELSISDTDRAPAAHRAPPAARRCRPTRQAGSLREQARYTRRDPLPLPATAPRLQRRTG